MNRRSVVVIGASSLSGGAHVAAVKETIGGSQNANIPLNWDVFVTNNSLAASSLMEALRSSLPERARRTRRPAPDVVRHPRITTAFVSSAGAGDRP